MQGSREHMTARINRRTFAVMSGVTGLGLGRALNAADEATVPATSDPPALTEHPLVPAIKHAQSCLDKVLEMKGYECEFSKKEVVGRQTITQTMRMKVREEPFSVYMYFLEPHEGREAIFVDGRNSNKLLVHETGLASLIGTLELEPTSSQVMAENRYPVTKAGMANMVRTVIAQWEEESKYGETDVKYFEDAKIGDAACRVIESSHPTPRKQFKFHMTRLWIEVESGLAVRIQQFGFPKTKDAKPPVLEDYTFSKIKPEVRLTDRDFDPENPSYNY
jgi:hypothetical protein